jgi:hypothetical protein
MGTSARNVLFFSIYFWDVRFFYNSLSMNKGIVFKSLTSRYIGLALQKDTWPRKSE